MRVVIETVPDGPDGSSSYREYSGDPSGPSGADSARFSRASLPGRTLPHTFDGLDSLTRAQGKHLGYGEWHEITQEQVQQFADATGDHQWIHLDTERAAKGPFGGTVAHGYLTLSLLPMLGREIYDFRGFSMGVNYGLNKVRFPSAVRVGKRVRAGAELKSVTPVAMGVQAVFAYTIEIEGEAKPGCVAEAVVLLVAGKDTT